MLPRLPNLNPYSEAWAQRTKHEVLNHFLVFGERHLRYILKSWLEYYHRWRPRQGLGNVRLEERNLPPPVLSEVVPLGERSIATNRWADCSGTANARGHK
jgi:transposase InsO family protein